MSLGFWQRRAAVDGAAAVPAASLWIDRFHRCAVAPERQPLAAARRPRVDVASESVWCYKHFCCSGCYNSLHTSRAVYYKAAATVISGAPVFCRSLQA